MAPPPLPLEPAEQRLVCEDLARERFYLLPTKGAPGPELEQPRRPVRHVLDLPDGESEHCCLNCGLREGITLVWKFT